EGTGLELLGMLADGGLRTGRALLAALALGRRARRGVQDHPAGRVPVLVVDHVQQVREPLGGGVELLVAEGALAAAVARGAVGAGVLRRLPRLLGGGRGGPGLRGQLVAAGAGRGSPQEGDGPRAGGGAPQNAA